MVIWSTESAYLDFQQQAEIEVRYFGNVRTFWYEMGKDDGCIRADSVLMFGWWVDLNGNCENPKMEWVMYAKYGWWKKKIFHGLPYLFHFLSSQWRSIYVNVRDDTKNVKECIIWYLWLVVVEEVESIDLTNILSDPRMRLFVVFFFLCGIGLLDTIHITETETYVFVV